MKREAELAAAGMSARRLGTADGSDAIVLLHGIPGSGEAWRPVGEQLARDFDVIVPDLLGFGASTRRRRFEELEATSQASALADLLDALDVRSAVVVGHDYGGPVALHLSAIRPDLIAAVGLLSTNTFGDTPIPFPLSALTWPTVGRRLRPLIFSQPSLRLMLRQGVGDGAPALDPEVYLGDRRQQAAIATIFAEVLTRLGELSGPVEEALRALRVPVWVGWGDRDPFFSVAQGRRTAEAAGAAFRIYPGAGHFLPEERPEEVADDLASLCRSVSHDRGAKPSL